MTAGLERTAGAGLPGPRLPKGAARSARLATVRVCNTAYHRSAVLDRLPLGAPLTVAFDYDPGLPACPSAGFLSDGVKVGDAPRREREWFGLLLNAGRRINARLVEVRAPTRHDSRAWRVECRLDREWVGPPLRRPHDAPFGGPAPKSHERFLDLVAGGFGLEPVYLETAVIDGCGRHEVEVGEPLHLLLDREVWFETLGGERLGVYAAARERMIAELLAQGVVIAAVVVGLARCPSPAAWAALYLVG